MSSEAIETLNNKLASGEITEEEYKRRRKLIESQTTGMSPWLHLYVIFASTAASLSLLSLFRDFIKIHQFFQDIINAWTAIIRPLTDFLFSWMFEIFGFTMPVWVGDYLIVGVIVALSRLRAHYITPKYYLQTKLGWFILRTIYSFLLWPVYCVEQVYVTIRGGDGKPGHPLSIYAWSYFIFSPFIYFLIFLLANYTLFYLY